MLEALDAAELLWEELVLSEESLLCEVLEAVELLVLWELLLAALLVLWEPLPAVLLPLEELDEDAGVSSLEELLLSPLEEDVLPDELEEALELLELLALEELVELLDTAPLTVTSSWLLVTVQSL